MKKITGLSFNEIKLKRFEKVMPLSSVNKSVKINDCKVAVDPLLLFQELLSANNLKVILKNIFNMNWVRIQQLYLIMMAWEKQQNRHCMTTWVQLILFSMKIIWGSLLMADFFFIMLYGGEKILFLLFLINTWIIYKGITVPK